MVFGNSRVIVDCTSAAMDERGATQSSSPVGPDAVGLEVPPPSGSELLLPLLVSLPLGPATAVESARVRTLLDRVLLICSAGIVVAIDDDTTTVESDDETETAGAFACVNRWVRKQLAAKRNVSSLHSGSVTGKKDESRRASTVAERSVAVPPPPPVKRIEPLDS